MEYVEGITVRDLIDQRGTLAVSATLAIARQLVDSLAVAHEVGIIHRDIKPQNLLLDEEGVLKVMEFGVARLAERTRDLTEAGLILGTPSYMPPEQLLGDSVDARCDLYAAGVVMYECLTGQLPFEARSAVSLIAKVLNDEPAAPITLQHDIPPAFSALIMTLLAKAADDRVQTATELAERLAGLA
jgi:serine/threonine-protein kinase